MVSAQAFKNLELLSANPLTTSNQYFGFSSPNYAKDQSSKRALGAQDTRLQLGTTLPASSADIRSCRAAEHCDHDKNNGEKLFPSQKHLLPWTITQKQNH
jgi:hypothetical protein